MFYLKIKLERKQVAVNLGKSVSDVDHVNMY
jgi:hypothetical protein